MKLWSCTIVDERSPTDTLRHVLVYASKAEDAASAAAIYLQCAPSDVVAFPTDSLDAPHAIVADAETIRRSLWS